MKDRNTFKDDIDRAERAILIYSWLGIVSASLVIGYSLWCLV